MTPELEAKAQRIHYMIPAHDNCCGCLIIWESDAPGILATVLCNECGMVFQSIPDPTEDMPSPASQLSAERKWWIERIEQERDKRGGTAWCALDDLLTSVRERGGK